MRDCLTKHPRPTLLLDPAEQRRRRAAPNYARASVGLEGFRPDREAETLAQRYVDGELTIEETSLPRNWRVGDKTGNNGIDAAGDIAVVWPKSNAPVLVCAYTQGGVPTAAQLESVFAAIGRIVGERLG